MVVADIVQVGSDEPIEKPIREEKKPLTIKEWSIIGFLWE
jgi:hypothetical protein